MQRIFKAIGKLCQSPHSGEEEHRPRRILSKQATADDQLLGENGANVKTSNQKKKSMVLAIRKKDSEEILHNKKMYEKCDDKLETEEAIAIDGPKMVSSDRHLDEEKVVEQKTQLLHITKLLNNHDITAKDIEEVFS